ncbi:MAG: ABC transporter substrate-binding protein [Thermomicrobiales bacterium]
MSGSREQDAFRVSRRRLLQATGGVAGAAAFGGALGSRGLRSASAADDVAASIWGNHPEWKTPMQEILDGFQAAVPGVKLDPTEVPGDGYAVKLNTAVAGGQPSDVMGVEEGSIISKWVPSGDAPFVNLTGKVDISGLTDAARSQVEVGGKVYGVPLAAYTVGLAINNTVFAKHNLTPPTTWDEFRTTAKALKDAGETPIVLGGKDWVHTFFMYIGLTSSVLGFDGLAKVRAGQRQLTEPDVLAAAQLLKELQPYYNAGFEATDYTTAKAIFANNKGAMMVAGTADFTGYKQVNPKADLTFVAWPGPQAGMKATTTGYELLYTASKFSAPEKQDAAAKFINWLATKDSQQLVSDKIALPINKGVTGSTEPIRAATVTAAAGGDVPVWYDLPELNGVITAVQDNFGGLWTGRLTPDAFVALLQAGVNRGAASGAGAATPTT